MLLLLSVVERRNRAAQMQRGNAQGRLLRLDELRGAA
jgi:hypothetical protein